MPRVEAKAAFLAGCADSSWISFSTSQLATFLVPAYTPGAEPLTLRVTVCVPWPSVALGVGRAVPLGDAVGLCGGGLSGGGVASFTAVDSVNGSGPLEATGCRNTSPPAVVEVPLGRVRTTTRAATAATATSAVASRGTATVTDRHQGPFAGPGPPGPSAPPDPPDAPAPPGGAGGGGGGGPCCPPESGPDGGPVGRSDDGGRPEGCVVTGSPSKEECVPCRPLCAPSGWCPQAGSATVAG